MKENGARLKIHEWMAWASREYGVIASCISRVSRISRSVYSWSRSLWAFFWGSFCLFYKVVFGAWLLNGNSSGPIQPHNRTPQLIVTLPPLRLSLAASILQKSPCTLINSGNDHRVRLDDLLSWMYSPSPLVLSYSHGAFVPWQ